MNDATPTYDPATLLKMSTADLDNLFGSSPPGPIPNGEAEGTALIDPGTAKSVEVARLINHFAWQGKVFDAASGTLVNHITVFGIKAILAKVYLGDSLIDRKPCIVIDYSKRSVVAEPVRDEIRMIAPGMYLGRIYWNDEYRGYFALQLRNMAAQL